MRRLLGIKQGEPIMMLGGKDKVLSASICNKINPRLRRPVLGSEVAEEIIIDDIRAVGIQLVVIDISLVCVSVVSVPPVPFSINLPWC